ncbi:MAG TPA: glycosyltransferase family 9 protein [Candidatus Eisenbacteria bacterium]|nr:glycosyltransferase family 9 protein [Candidatus Eisenbacteria bacterium]
MPSQGNILVIRGGAIGDFILTLPVFAALRQQFPQAHLEVLGYPHIAQLALASGLVDRMQSIEARALAGFFARDGELAEGLRDYFSDFAIIVSYLYDPDGIFRTNIRRCSKALLISGPHRPDETAGEHATEVFLRPLEKLAIFDAPSVPELRMIPDTKKHFAREALRAQTPSGSEVNSGLLDRTHLMRGCPTTLALHPGSGSERKNWPETKWTELLVYLVEESELRLLLIGGEAEGNRLERLAALLPPARYEIARNMPLVDLALRVSSCVAFIGHDSGISHLAAAVGLPALVLWGESVEEVWHPKGKNVAIIRNSAGVNGITVTRIKAELAQVLAGQIRRPCEKQNQ